MAAKTKKAAATGAVAPASDKKAALETVMQRIERESGKGSIMRLGENASMNVSAVSFARFCARYRRCSARKNYRDLRSRVLG